MVGMLDYHLQRTLVLRHEDEGTVEYELVDLFRPARRDGAGRVRPRGGLREALRRLIFPS